jgi:glycosyltransferase involved in cell wall biosynthesis
VIHDAFFWQMPENYPSWWRTYFLRLIKKGLKEKTQLITTTNYAMHSLRPYLGDNWPISVIYQAPKGMLGATDTQFLSQQGLSAKDYFLHVGTFDRRKNLPQLVLAYAAYRKRSKCPKKLVLAGGAGQSQQMNDFPKVKELIASLGLEDQVILPGYCSDGAVKALYEGGFGYVFPSKNEGFGIPILEAMHAGIPVIHSDQPALVEVAGGAGLPFQTDDLTDLTEKMILLEEENGLYTRLVQQGNVRAQAFSAKKFIDDFHRIILGA